MDLNIKLKTVKPPQDNTEDLGNHGFGSKFLDTTPKA